MNLEKELKELSLQTEETEQKLSEIETEREENTQLLKQIRAHIEELDKAEQALYGQLKRIKELSALYEEYLGFLQERELAEAKLKEFGVEI